VFSASVLLTANIFVARKDFEQKNAE